MESGGREFAIEGSGLDTAGLSPPLPRQHPTGAQLLMAKVSLLQKYKQVKKKKKIFILEMMGGATVTRV